MLFNAGCNKQVFSSKPWKNFWCRSILSFSRKTHTFNSEKWRHWAEGEANLKINWTAC